MKHLLTLIAIVALATITPSAVRPPQMGPFQIRTQRNHNTGRLEWKVGKENPQGPTVFGPWEDVWAAGNGDKWIMSAEPYTLPCGCIVRVVPNKRPDRGFETLAWIPGVGPMWLPVPRSTGEVN